MAFGPAGADYSGIGRHRWPAGRAVTGVRASFSDRRAEPLHGIRMTRRPAGPAGTKGLSRVCEDRRANARPKGVAGNPARRSEVAWWISVCVLETGGLMMLGYPSRFGPPDAVISVLPKVFDPAGATGTDISESSRPAGTPCRSGRAVHHQDRRARSDRSWFLPRPAGRFILWGGPIRVDRRATTTRKPSSPAGPSARVDIGPRLDCQGRRAHTCWTSGASRPVGPHRHRDPLVDRGRRADD